MEALFRTIAIGERNWTEFHWNKKWAVIAGQVSGEALEGAGEEKQRDDGIWDVQSTLGYFWAGGCFSLWFCRLCYLIFTTEVRPLPFHRAQEIGCSSFNARTSKGWFQVPKKDISWVLQNLLKTWEKIAIYYRGAEREFTIVRFVSRRSKEREVETRPKCGQAAGGT